jgi:hypothetical protein
MSTRFTTTLTDDLDGTRSSEDDSVATRSFALGRSIFEAEFSDRSYEQLTSAMEPFISVARLAGRPAKRSVAQRAKSADIRQWAAENDLVVAARGRIPESVVQQYEKAH